MPRHLKSSRKDRVIDFAVWFWGALRILAYRVDMRLTPVLTYFQTTPYGTITTDILAYVAVTGILLFPVAMLILWIVITF